MAGTHCNLEANGTRSLPSSKEEVVELIKKRLRLSKEISSGSLKIETYKANDNSKEDCKVVEISTN